MQQLPRDSEIKSPSEKPIRQSDRAPLQIDLTEFLFRVDDRQKVRCLGVDVSREGLGIVGFGMLVEKDQVVLVVNGKGIALEVVWVRSDQVRSGVQHVGLKALDAASDVEKELQKAGLLKRVEAWQFPKARNRLY